MWCKQYSKINNSDRNSQFIRKFMLKKIKINSTPTLKSLNEMVKYMSKINNIDENASSAQKLRLKYLFGQHQK